MPAQLSLRAFGALLAVGILWSADIAAAQPEVRFEPQLLAVRPAPDFKSQTADQSRSDRQDTRQTFDDTDAASYEDDRWQPEPHNFFIDLNLGRGTYEHDESGSPFSDDTDGAFFRVRLEGQSRGVGAGIALEGFASNDDLFAEIGGVDGQGSTGDLFFYLLFSPDVDPAIRLPVRVGPYFRSVQVEENFSGEIEWNSIGARVEIEPEWWIHQSRDVRFGVTGSLSLGVHVTQIEEEFFAFEETYDGNGYTLGASIGLEALLADTFSISLEYLYRQTHEDESSFEGSFSIPELDATFDGFVLGIGFRF